MGRKKIWFGKVRLIKAKVGEETFFRYKAYLISQKTNIQDDLLNYIIKTIK